MTVGSIERGDHPASVLAFRRQSAAFGPTVSELLDERDPPPGRPRF